MNARIFLALSVAALSMIATAEPIKYTIHIGQDKVGTLVDEITGDDTAGYVDDSMMTMSHDGMSTTIHEIARYGKDGIDFSKTLEVSQDGHNLKVRAKLSDDGAKLSIWEDDDKDEKEVPLANKTSRVDATNFWWKTAAPQAGDSVTYQAFDMEEMKWADVTLKYVGKVKVKIGDKEYDANEVDRTQEEESSKVYLDDKGDVLVMEDGDMRIERDM